ncbi:hypothetical protein CCAX7_44920 [Capsulimonas corticalis]|uniref:Uncharacterized protein n=1 Tax=Capsulimonas corticalis TaxID=2219043 RepID=A0A402D6J4_9BACT|nr:MFS transporter [Capsulimonas corticalis]BDI32441.1 hypothetical protein CCAX7_44920 [Capsulimonas corticalis]
MTPTLIKETEPAPDLRASVLKTALLVAGTVAVDTFVNALSVEKLNFLYKDQMALTAGGVATLGIFTNIPAYLRPAIGFLSDIVPFAGYHRRSYFFAAALVEAAALFALSLLRGYSYAALVLLLIGQTAGIVLMFVIMEAVLVRTGNATGQTGRLQTIQQFVRSALVVAVAAHLSGYVTQHWSYGACFLAASLMALLALPLTWFIDEKKSSYAADAERTPSERMREKWRESAQSFAVLKTAFRSDGLWAVVAFIFYLILTPGTGSAQFFYQVDYLRFTPQFLGDLNGWGAAGSVVGFLTYAAIAPRLPARMLVFGLVLLDCLGYVPLLWMRDTTSAIAITFGGSVLGGWYLLALLGLGARACPPKIEATVYGMVYAAQFLGSTLGGKLGGSIYDAFGGAQHHYRAGWEAVCWAGALFSLLGALFIPFLPKWARSARPMGEKSV